ncbi:hypothetical protein [Moheibacter stercoris]|uniref:Outer membrane protein beta-barrel domain-containing protein n=1 Tax=Moheibacter stercoris TaxID=1628251 RepID=A0ABV2LU75_9FLAO
MKQFLLVSILSLIGFNMVKAQNNFEIGVIFGTTVNEVYGSRSGNIGGGVAYYFQPVQNLRVGPMVLFDHFLSNDEYGLDASFLDIAASAKYNFIPALFGGLDLGYAVALDEGMEGGLMVRPRFGWSTRLTDLYIAYKGILAEQNYYEGSEYNFSAVNSLSSVTLGLNFKF